jgi:hypothetical protein
MWQCTNAASGGAKIHDILVPRVGWDAEKTSFSREKLNKRINESISSAIN